MKLDESWKEVSDKLATIPASGNINYDVSGIYLKGVNSFRNKAIKDLQGIVDRDDSEEEDNPFIEGIKEAIALITHLKAE